MSKMASSATAVSFYDNDGDWGTNNKSVSSIPVPKSSSLNYIAKINRIESIERTTTVNLPSADDPLRNRSQLPVRVAG